MDYKLYSPEKYGVKSINLKNFIEALSHEEENQDIHSFMLMREGKVLAEGYTYPYTFDTPHEIFSGSKAFAAMAIGFAVNEGLLSIDDKIVKYFADYVPDDSDKRLNKVTVKNLLTMTVGQKGDPVHCATYSKNDNWLFNFFMREFVAEPGSEFRYDGFATYILSALINRVSGQDMMTYLNSRLFEPMDMAIPYHIKDKYGICIGYTGMRMTIGDYAKIGQMFLDDGKYKGRQILPEGWVEISSVKHIDTPKVTTGEDWNQGYCFQMWRGRHNTYRLCGAFGQMCVIIPDYNMIFAVQSGYDNNKIHLILDKFYKHILSQIDLPMFEDFSANSNGIFKRITLTDIENDKCTLILHSDKDIKLPCGIGKGIVSEPLFTELVSVNPVGGKVKFCSELNYISDTEFYIKVLLVGTPARVDIKIIDGVADIEYSRCKGV